MPEWSPADGTPVPRRDDGAPAKLWYGPRFHAVRAMFELESDDAVVGFTVRPLPASRTGRSVDQPERMYAVTVYSYATGEIVAESEMRREQVTVLRYAVDLALDASFPPEEPQ